MNIAHIIPGSGGSFYCGNCLRDSKYFDAIRAQGHNAIKIPMYLPLFANDDTLETEIPVFYGAISIYLKQVMPIFRHAPAWVDKLLNAKPMLKFAARMANSTRASGLEDMTISMLMGEHGKQKEELEHMVDWLENHFKADVIHISNALLLGLAHKLKERLGVPVICSLQDEDVWIDPMHAEVRDKVWALMTEKAADIDVFVAVSQYYASFMKDRLMLPDEKITTLHLGVDPADYTYTNAAEKKRHIGFLSRMCYENGFDILVDAFIRLKQDSGMQNVKLIATGGHTADDHAFLKTQKQKIAQAGLQGDVIFREDFSPQKRQEFFEQIRLLSVPTRNGEAFGIFLTEAMAAGIPVVQPPLGGFVEIINKSQGGLLCKGNTPEALAEAMAGLLNDDDLTRKLSTHARNSIVNSFNIHTLAGEMIKIYEQTANKV